MSDEPSSPVCLPELFREAVGRYCELVRGMAEGLAKSLTLFGAAAAGTFDPTRHTIRNVLVLESMDPPCPSDFDGSRIVAVPDLLLLLANWGPCPLQGSCTSDTDGDGQTNVPDLLKLLADWGVCD